MQSELKPAPPLQSIHLAASGSNRSSRRRPLPSPRNLELAEVIGRSSVGPILIAVRLGNVHVSPGSQIAEVLAQVLREPLDSEQW
jgi:hypothetical protein